MLILVKYLVLVDNLKCSAYNGDGDGYSWMMPGHEWDYQVGVNYQGRAIWFLVIVLKNHI